MTKLESVGYIFIVGFICRNIDMRRGKLVKIIKILKRFVYNKILKNKKNDDIDLNDYISEDYGGWKP